MEKNIDQTSIWDFLHHISDNLTGHRLADVCRFISFCPNETYGPHEHLRIEINYVKKGSCSIHLDTEDVAYAEGDIMIIASHTRHLFEAGPDGATLMQLEFLPDIFTRLNPDESGQTGGLSSLFLFSEQNRLIKIVNNERMAQTIGRIMDELEMRSPYYQHLVVMYYAELLVQIRRHMDEHILPVCPNEALRMAIVYLRRHYRTTVAMRDVAAHCGVSERYLRVLFARHLCLSPLDYLNRLRIEEASDLLRNTHLSVKEVCFRCGFRSPQYFSRLFRQLTGKSPREIGG